MVEKTKTNNTSDEELKEELRRKKRSENFQFEQNTVKDYLKITDQEIEYITKGLPAKKYYEFAWHMLFQNKFTNLDLEWKKWEPFEWKEWSYPIFDLHRFNIIILQNSKYIRDKKIIDIGCSLGYLSLFCLNLNCKNLIGIDVREQKLSIADFICSKAGFSNFKFKKVDINDKEDLINVCNDVDTILFPGVLYHVSNHYEILQNLSSTKATTMIIENQDSSRFYNNHNPNIHWLEECVDADVWESSRQLDGMLNGYSNNHKNILVGKANQAWINIVMKELGWTFIKSEYFPTNTDINYPPRCCSVFIR